MKIKILVLSIATNQFTVPLPTGKEVVRAVNAHAAMCEALRPLAEYQYENVAKYTHDGDSRPQVHVSILVEEIEAARAALAHVSTQAQRVEGSQ